MSGDEVLNFTELFRIFSAEDSGETESIEENISLKGAITQMSHYQYLFQAEYECELSPEAHRAIDFHQQSLTSMLGTVWQLLKSSFMEQSGLRVWPEYEGGDKFRWCVYNSFSGQSQCFEYEDDLRIWIEQVHYRRS